MFMPKLEKSPHNYVLNTTTNLLPFTKFEFKSIVYELKTKSKHDRQCLKGIPLIRNEEKYGYGMIVNNGSVIESNV